jgi:acetolactate synthase-1/2/3 large subunit
MLDISMAVKLRFDGLLFVPSRPGLILRPIDRNRDHGGASVAEERDMENCGSYLIRLIERYGIDVAFGIPGVHTVEIYRGLAASGIRHVTPRHEQGAGFMADGYARVTGRPALCIVTTGPGITNILTAMGQAYADSIPMLVLSSVTATGQLGLGSGTLHELPSQRNLVAGVAAFSHTILDPRQIPEVVAHAFAVFRSQRPRPVHIEIPTDVIRQSASSLEATPRRLPSAAGPLPGMIAEAAALLAAARAPIMVLGGGAVGGAVEARALAERLNMPVINTVNAKGILPAGHPLHAGENLGFAPLHDALRDADVALAVGTEFGETEMYPAPVPVEIGGKLIRIDIDPGQLVRPAAAHLPIQSDAKGALSALLKEIDARGIRNDVAGTERARALREAVQRLWWPQIATHGRIIEVVDRVLEDPIIVGDSTEIVYAANQFYRPGRPRSWFNSSTGYGTLGYGLPAGIGAKLAAPDRPVVVLIGDGGLQFTIAEMAAAVEAATPIILLLWNNQGYGEIKNYMIERQIAPIGVDIFTPDFLAIARGFGWAADSATSLDHLASLLAAAAVRSGPSLIELRDEGRF